MRFFESNKVIGHAQRDSNVQLETINGSLIDTMRGFYKTNEMAPLTPNYKSKAQIHIGQLGNIYSKVDHLMEKINTKQKNSQQNEHVHFYHIKTNETNNDIIVGEEQEILVTENQTHSQVDIGSKEENRSSQPNLTSTFKTKHKSLHVPKDSNTGSAIFSNTELTIKG